MGRTAVHGFLAILGVLLAASPAFAGQVLVPVSVHHGPDSRISYRTLVWITNAGPTDAEAVTRFVEQGADGTPGTPGTDATGALPAGGAAIAAGGPASVLVPAGETVLLADAAPAGKSGLLEVTGAADLVVRARLEALDATSPGGQPLASAAVQGISAAGALAPGQAAQLLGLGRQAGGAVTDLALLNLADQAAVCQVSAFRADGGSIAPAASVGVPPQGARAFEDAFGLLGEQQLEGGRFSVTCDQPFYAYATVYLAGGAVSEVVTPSAGILDSALTGGLQPIVAIDAAATPAAFSGPAAAPAEVATAPGAGPETAASAVPQRSTTAAGVVTLVVPGVFLHATTSNSYVGYELGAPRGVAYRQAKVDFDLTIKDFNHVLLFTGVTSLRRPNKNRRDRVLYYALQLVNRNQKTVLDLGVQDRIARTQGPWKAGHTYHLSFIYDLRGRQVKLNVSENGRQIYTIQGPALHFDLSSNANPLTVDFGQTGIGDGAYGPPIGWTYANLTAQLLP